MCFRGHNVFVHRKIQNYPPPPPPNYRLEGFLLKYFGCWAPKSNFANVSPFSISTVDQIFTKTCFSFICVVLVGSMFVSKMFLSLVVAFGLCTFHVCFVRHHNLIKSFSHSDRMIICFTHGRVLRSILFLCSARLCWLLSCVKDYKS